MRYLRLTISVRNCALLAVVGVLAIVFGVGTASGGGAEAGFSSRAPAPHQKASGGATYQADCPDTDYAPDICTVGISNDNSGKIDFVITYNFPDYLYEGYDTYVYIVTDQTQPCGIHHYQYLLGAIGHDAADTFEFDKCSGNTLVDATQGSSFTGVEGFYQLRFSINARDIGGSPSFALFLTTSYASPDGTIYEMDREPDSGLWTYSGTTGPIQRSLSVTKSGSGSGTITSNPVGINCTSSCSTTFNDGTSVTLTATPAAGSRFAGWSGDCSGTGACTVTMNANHSVTAAFNTAPTRTLTVSDTGAGFGAVTSSPAGINCGSTCSASFTDGTSVTLSATAAAGSVFGGWSGDCSGTSACTLNMTSNHSVVARFDPPQKVLAVSRAGSGTGSVTSSPAGINCGSTCSASFGDGAAVTLTATPTAGSSFAGWSGDCSGTGTCSLSMNTTHSVTATFNLECVVPRVVGKKLAAAVTAIKQAGCSVGKVSQATSKKPKGTVISQRPAAGTHVPAGTSLALVVSRGKKT